MSFESKLLKNIVNFNKQKLNKKQRCLMNKCYNICYDKESFLCKKHFRHFRKSITNVSCDNSIDCSFFFEFEDEENKDETNDNKNSKSFDSFTTNLSISESYLMDSFFEIELLINQNNKQIDAYKKVISEYKSILRKII